VNPSSSLERSSATPKSFTRSAVVLDALAMLAPLADVLV
jgi:hypothetical protein